MDRITKIRAMYERFMRLKSVTVPNVEQISERDLAERIQTIRENEILSVYLPSAKENPHG